MKACSICGESFINGRTYSNHVRWKHKKIEYKRISCNFCQVDIRCENITNHLSVCRKNPANFINCKQCNKSITGAYKVQFCNRSCSAKYNNARRVGHNGDKSYMTPEWRKNLSDKTKANWKKGLLKAPTHLPMFSSKNERAITKHFKESYPHDEWKSGGRLILSNGSFLSRDLWSDKLKICFEYDGIWHFKDIKGQLQKKQLKDTLLEEWCIQNKYRLVRIDELNYKYIEQIVDLIYRRDDTILKIGDRYR